MDLKASDRTRRLLGDEAVRRLECARVLVFGLGGVGSWCVEALARSGVGTLGLVDRDSVSISNRNRQLCALVSTQGRMKTDVVSERLSDINPALEVFKFNLDYGPQTESLVPLAGWNVVVDAIDQVSAKVLLFLNAKKAGVKFFSAMGGGNKLDPTRFRSLDLAKTNRCPLAAVMRKKLRRKGVRHGRVVASDEEPRVPFIPAEEAGLRHVPPGSIATVVGAEGLVLAQAVIDSIIGEPAAPRLSQFRDSSKKP